MIRYKTPFDKPVVDLTGPAGNAFALLGQARHWAKELELDPAPILAEMQEDDYEHLVNTLEKYFGEYVIFER